MTKSSTKDWQIKNIGEICAVIAGQSPAGEFYNKTENGLPFYQGKKEFGERYIKSPTVWTSHTTKVAESGDILMSVRAPVGPTNFATERICIGRGLAAIRAGDEIDKDFLFYFLQKFEDEIVGNQGAVFNSINKSQIESIEIPLPSLPEQRRLISLLDDLLKKLEKAKENAEKNLKNAKELFDSFLNSIFDGAKSSWAKYSLCEISENLDRQRVPITKKDRTEGDIPYYGASGVVDYVDDYIFDEDLLLVSEDGANLLARTYPIAFSVSGKIWVNNHAHVLKFKERVTQRFVEYYLNSISLEPYVSGMAQPKLNQASLNSIEIYLPELTEQQKIVDSLNELSSGTKKLGAIYKQKNRNFDELKQSILHQAFTGKL